MSILSRLKVPFFKAGGVPDIDERKYYLEVTGMVEAPVSFSLLQLKGLPKSAVNARLTSVSGWSVRATWEGVLWRDFIKLLKPLPTATHATFMSVGERYTTTISWQDLDHPRVLLVYAVDGEPLEKEYGGPLRMVVSHLYGYKSAKWLVRIDLCDSMRGGYWEDRGYSRSGEIEAGVTLDINTMQRRAISGGEILDF